MGTKIIIQELTMVSQRYIYMLYQLSTFYIPPNICLPFVNCVTHKKLSKEKSEIIYSNLCHLEAGLSTHFTLPWQLASSGLTYKCQNNKWAECTASNAID